VGVVAFSPDSMLLASTDDNGTVKLWNLSILAHPYQALCADVGPPTRQTWNEYVSGEPLPHICA